MALVVCIVRVKLDYEEGRFGEKLRRALLLAVPSDRVDDRVILAVDNKLILRQNSYLGMRQSTIAA